MTDSDATVRPAFANAHTHIGDSVAKEAGAGLSLDDLVAPPDGLGTSGARDDDFAERRRATREAGKPFGSHAGERDPHDHTPALDLDRIERDSVPVVVCPGRASSPVSGAWPGDAPGRDDEPYEELYSDTSYQYTWARTTGFSSRPTAPRA